MNINDLEELPNIIDQIVVPSPSIFEDGNTIGEIIDLSLQICYDYINDAPGVISEPEFENIIRDYLSEVLETMFENHICPITHNDNNMDDESDNEINVADEIEYVVDYVWDIFSTTVITERSNHNTDIFDAKDTDHDFITKQIEKLRSIPQPTQRTDEWYKFRHTLITASNAYKAFESQSVQNQLIYEKCKPLQKNDDTETQPVKMVNTNSSLHWGQKYEPISVMLYEDMYNTTVEDFGCLPHGEYNFLGASPDGIVVDKKSSRYGRMLEIKNVVSRVINGIPKKEYWVQMQLQMEVCNLDLCDFLETKFDEYQNEQDFINDTSDKTKGVILYFNTKENVPKYVYKPLAITEMNDINKWIEHEIDTGEKEGLLWIKTIYWKLETLSCVLVSRNKEWFNKNISQLKNIWDIILKERVEGYEHRAPKKNNSSKAGKASIKSPPPFQQQHQGCLLKIHTEKLSDNKDNNNGTM